MQITALTWKLHLFSLYFILIYILHFLFYNIYNEKRTHFLNKIKIIIELKKNKILMKCVEN